MQFVVLLKQVKRLPELQRGLRWRTVWSAAGFVWENRKIIGKIIIAIIAFLMIPIMLLCMLPSLIFGGLKDAFSPNDPNTPILNSSVAVESNLAEISTTVSTVLSESIKDVLQDIEKDYASCTADGKEIINPYESFQNFNANQFVGQYCAAKNEDYASMSVKDMENMLRQNKDKLYSYSKKEEERTVETVTVTVTVDVTTGKEKITETVITSTEKWIVYTITYKGEPYFADEVFRLNDKQKALANDYAQNLSLFLGVDLTDYNKSNMG